MVCVLCCKKELVQLSSESLDPLQINAMCLSARHSSGYLDSRFGSFILFHSIHQWRRWAQQRAPTPCDFFATRLSSWTSAQLGWAMRTCWSEIKIIVGAPLVPSSHLRWLLNRVVIENQIELEMPWNIPTIWSRNRIHSWCGIYRHRLITLPVALLGAPINNYFPRQ